MYTRYLGIILACITACSNAVDISYSPRVAFILLDDSEYQTGRLDALSGDLLALLHEEAGPIITSSSIVANIIAAPFGANRPSDTALFNLVTRFIQKKIAGATLTKDEEKTYKRITVYAARLNPARWVIKSINPYLCLLIPHSYLQALGIPVSDVESYTTAPEFTATEYTLGLQINHLRSKSVADIVQDLPSTFPSSSSYFIDALSPQDGSSGRIFCSRQAYAQTTYARPIWSFFVQGHGTAGQFVANLTIKKFKQFLDFCTTTIFTRFVAYLTCYSGGITSERIYADSKNAAAKTYPFAIASFALTEAATLSRSLAARLTAGTLSLETNGAFKAFATDTATLDVIPYEQVLRRFTDPLRSSYGSSEWVVTPLIRLPGLSWFTVLADRNDIVSIGSILAQARDPQNALDIPAFYKSDPQVLLLYANDIPFEIISSGYGLSTVISMLPGYALHRLKRLSSSTTPSYDMLDWFTQSEIGSEKVFFIESLNTLQNVLIYLTPDPAEYGQPPYIFFEENKTVFSKKPGEAPRKATTQEQLLYNRIRSTISADYSPRCSSFVFRDVASIKLPNYTEPCTIARLAGAPTSSVTLSSLLKALIQSTDKDILMWVKSLEGAYDGNILKLPGIKRGTFVKVDDVIVDPESASVLYTYQGRWYQDDSEIIEDYRPAYRPYFETYAYTVERAQRDPDMLKKLREIMRVRRPIADQLVSEKDIANDLQEALFNTLALQTTTS